MRSAIAAVVILAFGRGGGGLRTAAVAAPLGLGLVALSYAGTLTFYIAANKLTTAAHAIFLQSTAPMFVLLASPLLLAERPHRRDVSLAAAIAIGTVVLFFGDASRDGAATAPDVATGNLFGLAAGVCWAATLIGMRRLARRPAGASHAALAGNLATVAIVGPIAWFTATTTDGVSGIAHAPWSEWLVLAYLGTVQVGLAYVLLARAMVRVPAVTVSLLLMIEPAINPWMTWAVHGERPELATWIGGGLIVGALLTHGLAAHRASSARRRSA